jgi:hypothetical protein
MSFVSFNDRPLRTREEVAREVHAVSLRRGLDELATVIALMTIATEVGSQGQWWCPWNAKDPTSNNYPHDSESNDGRSVGYFQQQNGRAGEIVTGGDNWWGSMQSRMTLDQAADKFLERLTNDWRRAEGNPALAGQFAQDVQGSAFGFRYAQHWGEAWDVLHRALAVRPAGPSPRDAARFSGDPVWLEDVLRDALGDRLVVEGDWANRGTGGSMGEIWGVMIHHTANINETVAHIRDGVQQPGGFLHGPLAQCLLTPDGKCHLIAVGPCNHAGPGFYPGLGSDNGNRRLIGFECCWPTPRPDLPLGYDPHEQWSTPLVITMRDATAAVLQKLGVGSARAIGHKEYAPNRKIDPANMDMNWFRGEVQRDLDGVVFPGEQAVPRPGPLAAARRMAPFGARDDRQPLGELCDLLPGSGGHPGPEPDGDSVGDRLAQIERLAAELRSLLDELRAVQVDPHANGHDGRAAERTNGGSKPVAKKAPAKAVAKKATAKAGAEYS